MTTPLTLTAYAKLRGWSVKSVSRAIAAGRLVESVGRNERDQPTILDPELADREWAANTRQRADRQPDFAVARKLAAAAAARPAPDRVFEPRIMDLGAGVAPPDPPPVAASRADSSGEGPPSVRRRADLPEGVPVYHVSQAVRAAAAARREAALADQAELDLAARRGRLVDADRARADVEQAYSLVKARLLRVPSDLAQRLPHLAAEVVPVLEPLLRQALEELASPGGST